MDSLSASRCPPETQRNKNNPSLKKDPTHLESISERNKVAVLIQIFPGMKPNDIRRVLIQGRGLVGEAIDELLDQVFSMDSNHKTRTVSFSITGSPPPHPQVVARRNISSGPRRLHRATRRFMDHSQSKHTLDRRRYQSSDKVQPVLKSCLRKPSIKHSSDKDKVSTCENIKVLAVPTLKKSEDGAGDNGIAKSKRRAKSKIRLLDEAMTSVHL